MDDFNVSQGYKDRIAEWVATEMAASDADSYNKLALKISRIADTQIAAQQLNRWAIGKFTRRIEDPTLEKLARYKGMSLEAFRAMLEGNATEADEKPPKLSLTRLTEALTTCSRLELVQLLKIVAAQLEQREHATDRDMRYFTSLAEFLLDMFAKAGLSAEAGLARLQEIYTATFPSAGDSAKWERYLHGLEPFDQTDQRLCNQLAVCLKKLTGVPFTIQDIEVLRCPVCEEAPTQTGHTLQAN